MKPRRAFGAVATIVALSGLAGCGDGGQFRWVDPSFERPDQVTHGDRPPGYIVETLAELVATSDIVVVGAVESVAKGHSTSDEGGPPYARDVTVRVEKQYYGQRVGARIIVDQEGYDVSHDGGEVSYELMEQPWLYPGDRAVFFLEASDLPPKDHFIIVTPGQFTLRENGIVSITAPDDPIARQLDGAPWSTVERKIARAVQLVDKDGFPATPKPAISP